MIFSPILTRLIPFPPNESTMDLWIAYATKFVAFIVLGGLLGIYIGSIIDEIVKTRVHLE